MHYSSRIEVRSKGFSDVIDITAEVASILEKSGLSDGIISIFVPGSTASVTTIEYEEGVIDDLKNAIERIVPSTVAYKHDRRWGDGNGFSHVRAAFLKPGLTVPFMDKNPRSEHGSRLFSLTLTTARENAALSFRLSVIETVVEKPPPRVAKWLIRSGGQPDYKK